jgi:hypothetical protein
VYVSKWANIDLWKQWSIYLDFLYVFFLFRMEAICVDHKQPYIKLTTSMHYCANVPKWLWGDL